SAPSINVCQFVYLYLEAQGREVGPIPIHVEAGVLTCPNSARMNPPPLDLNRCHPEDGNPSLAKDSQRRIYAFSPLCHSESALAVRNLLFPVVVQKTRLSGHAFRPPATDAPCPPAPIGRNCHRTLSALLLIKTRQRMAKEPLSRTPVSVV